MGRVKPREFARFLPWNGRSLRYILMRPATTQPSRNSVMHTRSATLLLLNAMTFVMCAASQLRAEVVVSPKQLELTGRLAAGQLLVESRLDGKALDMTREAKYGVEPSGIVEVSTSGHVKPLLDGQAVVRIEIRGETLSVPVTVARVSTPIPVDFERDVMPVLSRFSCNSGACHGKQRGQNGFQLSLLGFDPDFDYEALAKEGRGRRVFAPAAERSLLLQKPIGELPHGGGRRIERSSAEYRVLYDWVSAGMPRRSQEPATRPATADSSVSPVASVNLTGIIVEPRERVLPKLAKQQLRVTAKYSDGSTRDVTRLSAYLSNEAAQVAVDDSGLMTAGPIVGDTAVIADSLRTLVELETA